MTRYSVQHRDTIFVEGYGDLCFAKNAGKNIGKNISKNVSGKYSRGMLAMRQKLLDHSKKSATNSCKTSSKRFIQKTAEATGDLIGNKIANKITKVSKYSPQNNSETVTNEQGKIYISPEKRQNIIVNLR